MSLAYASGMRLTSARLNKPLPLYAERTVDLSRTSNTTLTADGSLTIANLQAGMVYEARLRLIYRAGGTTTVPGLKIDYTIPIGADTTSAMFRVEGATARAGANGAVGGIICRTTDAVMDHTMILIMGGSAGTLTFRWAQNATSASATTIAAGSYLLLTPLS
jgi:hypothetical protein